MPSAGKALPHDSAEHHVSGEAPYVDDIPELAGTLHASVFLSPHAHARLKKIDLSAVRDAPGVAAVAAAENVPGEIDIGPVLPGDPLFARQKTEYAGQPIFAVAAADMKSARLAAKRANIQFEPLPAVLSIEEAMNRRSFIVDEKDFHLMQRGDAKSAIADSPHRLRGEISLGGQEHFYLEGQVAYAVPQENGGMLIYSSTQHPSEIQHAAAKVLGLAMNDVTVEVRRLGGGFGGKETQAAHPACIAALLAAVARRPVKLRLPRADDFAMTGKRHPFLNRYEVGFDGDGKILGIDFSLIANCGMSPDLSLAIVDRAMFHADNAYYFPAVRIRGIPCRTNTASNTAFRGFGGPQGMMAIEKAMEDIARYLGRDPLDVRLANLYRKGADETPYHQRVEDNIAEELIARLLKSSSYRRRRREIDAYNRGNPFAKRGIALTPVKFGISFTTAFLNQAGALIHVYHDGSIHLNHGGTEMGQGLFIKIAQVVAEEFQVNVSRVRCTATTTGKVPNTSATAASSGSDLNGKAAQDAARKIKKRLAEFAAAHFGVAAAEVVFADGRVCAGAAGEISFAELARLAYMNRVPLSAAGFYRTPKIHYDRKQGRGRPFLYFAYGAAVSEVEVDAFTGEHRLLRADILHDVGRSLNPAIDRGQVEGGFVQGCGWLTCEELAWDENGRLLTVGPATYKIPAVGDAPLDFRVAFFRGDNPEDTIFRSKAVGEPPLMLAISTWAALCDAVAAAANARDGTIHLDAPATPERILMAIESARAMQTNFPQHRAGIG